MNLPAKAITSPPSPVNPPGNPRRSAPAAPPAYTHTLPPRSPAASAEEPGAPPPAPSSISSPHNAHTAALPMSGLPALPVNTALRSRTAVFSDIFIFLSFSPFLPDFPSQFHVATEDMKRSARRLPLYYTIIWKKRLSHSGGKNCILLRPGVFSAQNKKGFDKTQSL